MKALSILQPWAWAILYAGKSVENRNWQPRNPGLRYRGAFLIHTGVGFDADGYHHLKHMAEHGIITAPIPPRDAFQRGGIVGCADIVDAVTDHPSPWFFGPYGLVLANARLVPFVPMKGQLGFFTVPAEIVSKAVAA